MTLPLPLTAPAPTLRRRRVLCADDHAQMADLIRVLLGRAGCDVVCVNDGEAAWNLLAGEPDRFDVVVTDQQMPGLNGMELVRRLHTMAFAGRMFVLTSGPTPEEEREFFALGVDAILRKPGGVMTLAAMLG